MASIHRSVNGPFVRLRRRQHGRLTTISSAVCMASPLGVPGLQAQGNQGDQGLPADGQEKGRQGRQDHEGQGRHQVQDPLQQGASLLCGVIWSRVGWCMTCCLHHRPNTTLRTTLCPCFLSLSAVPVHSHCEGCGQGGQVEELSPTRCAAWTTLRLV